MEFCDRLQQAMDAAGVDQSMLGRRLGITPSAVNQWISGRVMPRASRIMQIAAALGVPASSLLSASGFSEPQPSPSFPAPPDEMDRLPEVAEAVACMMQEEGLTVRPGRLMNLAQRALGATSALGRTMSFEDRLALSISELRSEVRRLFG